MDRGQALDRLQDPDGRDLDGCDLDGLLLFAETSEVAVSVAPGQLVGFLTLPATE